MMNIGIAGTGKMGSAIFKLLSSRPVNITVLAISQEEAEENRRKCFKGFRRHVKRGRITEEEYARKEESLRFTHKIEDLASSDLVIEAIFEDYDAKVNLFRELESVVSEKAILTTNTSSVSIKKLSDTLRHKERFCGLHFFHPVLLIAMVEIIRRPDTPLELITFLENFCRDMGKYPVTVLDNPGSVINSILAYYYLEAIYLLEEGVALPSEIDHFSKRFFYVGPCESMDVIGIDFLIGALKRTAVPGSVMPLRWDEDSGLEASSNSHGEKEGFYLPVFPGKLISDNRLGKAFSKGIYLYEKDKPVDDKPEFYRNPDRSSPYGNSDERADLISKQLLFSILNGAICGFQKGMSSMEELDFGVKEALIMKEGPFTIMKGMGKEKVCEHFEWLSRKVGKRFEQKNFDFLKED